MQTDLTGLKEQPRTERPCYLTTEQLTKFKTEMLPEDHDRSNIDICFKDEARFGQQNTTTRLWAEKG